MADSGKKSVADTDLMREEVIEGLRRDQKMVPSKYFYDEKGSRLFEQITRLDEYYPTRAELEIMKRHGAEMADLIGQGSTVIEFGSGSSKKTRYLLSELKKPTGYVPVDISADFLMEQAEKLRREFPKIPIQPLAADYTHPFSLSEELNGSKKVIFFPGSTVGNFRQGNARSFLLGSVDLLGNNGGLLIGVDMKKDPAILNRAYNDSKGITAQFNKNLLHRLNRELDANFEPDAFRHHAFYNEDEGRIEMHLVSKVDQTVTVAGEPIHFSKEESIHTENSYKYSPDEFQTLISEAYTHVKMWTDSENLFSVHYFETS